jgi:DNA end-binding protein Ku
MPRRRSKQTSNRKKRKTTVKTNSAGRPIWKGSINFGLVNIPVALHAATVERSIDFDLLDRRDFSRIRYQRVNEKTGRQVPWDQTVKGYEYKKGEYVALSDEDFVKANVEATQSIDITDFVDAAAISPTYFDKPYYLVPLRSGGRAYGLLREVLKRTAKAGIARVVIRTRQHLAALFVDQQIMILNLLRFPHEVRTAAVFDVPGAGSAGKANRELKMAEQLVETMMGEWKPEKYRDEYRDDLLELIDKKVKSGRTKTIAAAGSARPKRQAKVIDIMHLLRQSVEQVQKKEEPRRRKAS